MRLTGEIFELIDKLNTAEVRSGKNKGETVQKTTYLKLVILDVLNHGNRELTINEICDRLKEDDRTEGFTFDTDRAVRYHLNDMVKAELLETDKKFQRDKSFQQISNTKVTVYKLREENDALNFINVKKSSLEIIEAWKTILDKYKVFPIFEDLEGFANQYRKQLEDSGELEGIEPEKFKLIEFDTRTEFHDLDKTEMLGNLFVAVEERSTIAFTYQSYPRGDDREKSPTKYIGFHPYMIKEHKYRWYLVGKKKKGSDFFCLDVNRISDFKKNINALFTREKLPDNLWHHSMGIYTNWDDFEGNWSDKPIKISFKIKNGERYNNLHYLESSPIHHSQQPKILKKEKDGYATVRLNMFPDTDLVRKMRSMGNHNLKDIQPDSLSKWVKEK
jgi:DNA-binding transcriptional ArsR family regulator